MKIRQQINGVLAVSVLAIAASLGVTLDRANDLRQEMAEISAAENLITSTTHLRLIAVERVLYHEQRSPYQWDRKIKSIQAVLDHMPTSSPVEKSSVAFIRKNILLAQAVFPRLNDTQAADPDNSEMTASLRARTVTSIFVITQEIMDKAEELIRFNREDADAALRAMRYAIWFMGLSLSGVILFGWVTVSRGLLRPMRRVEEGAQRIAKGDYDFRLNINSTNEVGALADAFDEMTARVQNTKNELVVEVNNSKRAELALKQSVQYTQTILDNALDAILTLDEKGIIKSANFAVQSIFGYQSDAMLGQHFSHFLTESSFGEAGNVNAETNKNILLLTGKGREVEGQHREGRSFPIEMAITQSTHDGQLLYIVLARDISERRRVEQMKSEFVSTVSHELRTPLTSVSGSLSLMLGGKLGDLPAVMRPLFDIAHKNSIRLSHLINDLLDMEKLTAGKMLIELTPQPLMPLVDQAVESIRAFGEPLNVTFIVKERLDTVDVKVDGSRLLQVLTNLLSNAAKFSPNGGQVFIAACAIGQMVRVSITDHGQGVPEKFHSQIFQKFAQADSSTTRQKGGTGLGLAITREFVERMNGNVGFTSKEGKGACFFFELPIDVESNPDFRNGE